MQGLYLKDNNLIAIGKKTMVPAASPQPSLPGQRLLVVRDKEAQAVGIVTIGNSQKVSRKEFDAHYTEHQVTAADRMRWWADTEPLYLYPIESLELFAEPLPIDFEPGTKMHLNTQYGVEQMCPTHTEQLPDGRHFTVLLGESNDG